MEEKAGGWWRNAAIVLVKEGSNSEKAEEKWPASGGRASLIRTIKSVSLEPGVTKASA